jgi:hypothetical protein
MINKDKKINNLDLILNSLFNEKKIDVPIIALKELALSPVSAMQTTMKTDKNKTVIF